MNEWKNEIENWDRVSKDMADLYLKQSELVLSEQAKTANTISGRTDKLLGVNLSFLMVVLGYVVTNLKVGWNSDVLIHSSFFAVVFIAYSMWYVVKNLRPYEIRIQGELPKFIAHKAFVDNENSAEENYILLVLNQINNYQNRIDLNKDVNSKRMKNNSLALWSLVFLPISLVLGWVLNLFLT